MNIEHLKTLQEIARLCSFSEVAKKLHISQPAVSFQIQKLEHELGVQLIDRSQRSVELTEAGKRLLRFAETVEEEREKLRRDLDNMREEVTGELLTGASTIPGEYILPGLLAKFKNLHPAVTIRVEVSDSLTVMNRIRENIYETGFCGVLPDGQDLGHFKIGEDEIVLIANREHPFAGKTEIRPEDLAGEPFIFREDTSGTQRSLEKMLEKSGLDISKLTPRLILGSTQAVISAVAAGAGIAFISSLAIKDGGAPAVKQIPLHGLHFNRDFYCIFRRERAASRLSDEFKSFMQTETSIHA
jgi:DNA-binding transcriptional LysR family regulator